MTITPEQRARFDALVEEVLAELPPRYVSRLDEIPLVVEDRPDAQLLREMGLEDDPNAADELCGLHTGVALTERTVEDNALLPDEIRIFRHGVVEMAGGWFAPDADTQIREEIRITILHELGHHFGLDEDDLEELGYD